MAQLTKNAILYVPDEDVHIKAVVQIVHDMAEHQFRYKSLSLFLTEHGYAVITSDLRGHGETVDYETDLGFFGDNAVNRLVGDVHDITIYVKNTFKDVPYILLGTGMGSLILTAYLKKYDNFIDGLFLLGMPADRSMRKAEQLMLIVLKLLKGEYYRPKMIDSAIVGGWAKNFKREGLEFAWLSSDRDQVLKYENDPRCGYIYTVNGFTALLDLFEQAYEKGSWVKKQLSLPIRLFAGEKDPCIPSFSKYMNSVNLFTGQGYEDVAYIRYNGQRHDILHDLALKRVYNDILSQLEDITDASCFHSR